jgi:pullulanase/glycogen debranching enzyme
LRGHRLVSHDGRSVTLAQIPYGGGAAGYVDQPGEVVNYVENHDNQTLYDLLAFKLPQDTPADERARVQLLALAINAFSQGVAYFHAGGELLRSKSMDRNSYDSGDWFNRVDWTGQDNFFGTGLPPAWDNRESWPLMAPRLADARLRPAPAHIAFTRDAFLDLLRIRAGTRLLRLTRADDIAKRLHLPPTTAPHTLLAGHLDGRGLAGAGFADLIYLVNVDTEPREMELPALRGRALQLHPVHRAPEAADRRAREARFDAASGRFRVPPRTAVVFVAP